MEFVTRTSPSASPLDDKCTFLLSLPLVSFEMKAKVARESSVLVVRKRRGRGHWPAQLGTAGDAVPCQTFLLGFASLAIKGCSVIRSLLDESVTARVIPHKTNYVCTSRLLVMTFKSSLCVWEHLVGLLIENELPTLVVRWFRDLWLSDNSYQVIIKLNQELLIEKFFLIECRSFFTRWFLWHLKRCKCEPTLRFYDSD